MASIVNLFDIVEEHLKEMEQLKGYGIIQSIVEKKYKHIVYIYELVYTISISQYTNVSKKPGCKWQL